MYQLTCVCTKTENYNRYCVEHQEITDSIVNHNLFLDTKENDYITVQCIYLIYVKLKANEILKRWDFDQAPNMFEDMRWILHMTTIYYKW